MYFKRGWVKIPGISRSLAVSTRISLESNIPSSASFMLLPKPWTCPGFPGPRLYFYMTRVPNAAMLQWESFIIVRHQSHRGGCVELLLKGQGQISIILLGSRHLSLQTWHSENSQQPRASLYLIVRSFICLLTWKNLFKEVCINLA